MPILSVLNPKGGSGKTTLSLNLARALHERGKSVLLVDSDPQGSARDWHAAQEANPLPLVAIDRANTIRTITRTGRDYDFVVIDGAAKLGDILAATIKVSDFILIPVQPSPFDIWAASDLVEVIKTRQEVTEDKPIARFVVTRRIENAKLSEDVKSALNEYELGALETMIAQRQVYPRTAAEGLTVFDGRHTKASAEIDKMTSEILIALSGA